jgi:hypothetical protein
VLALMAVRAQTLAPDQAFLTASEIAQFSEWLASKASSVGTEVYNAFSRLGLTERGWVESPAKGKLKMWRWTRVDQLQFSPNVQAVEAAISADSKSETLDAYLSWLAPAIQSLCLSNGVDARAAADAAQQAIAQARSAPPITRAALQVNYARAVTTWAG